MALVLAGAVTGAGHLGGAWWPLAWIGVALVAAAARAPGARPGWVGAGLVLGGVASLLVAHPWHAAGLGRYVPGGAIAGDAWVVPYDLLFSLFERLPIFAAWLVARRFGWPAWAWLPLGWWAGEALWDATLGISHDAWLYSQWQVPAVLRAVGQLGWSATLVACLAAAAAAGEALAGRDARHLALTLAVALGLAALPPLATTPAAALAQLGAVHMQGYGRTPAVLPPGVQLLVWPEVATGRIPHLAEGPGHGERVWLPVKAPGLVQILGEVVHAGPRTYNAQIGVQPDGTVIGMRAKARLFPLVERPVLGLSLPICSHFTPGTLPPVLDLGRWKATCLLCLEAVDGPRVAAGRRAGANLVTLASNDRGLGDDPLAHEQVLACAVLRAVEAHAPLVRAARNGEAAIIDADGRVLARSAPGSDGVLTVAGDFPAIPAAPREPGGAPRAPARPSAAGSRASAGSR